MICHLTWSFPTHHCLEYVLFPFCCVYVYVVFSQLKCRREKLGRRENRVARGQWSRFSDQIIVAKCFLPRSDRILSPYSFPGRANTCPLIGDEWTSLHKDNLLGYFWVMIVLCIWRKFDRMLVMSIYIKTIVPLLQHSSTFWKEILNKGFHPILHRRNPLP